MKKLLLLLLATLSFGYEHIPTTFDSTTCYYVWDSTYHIIDSVQKKDGYSVGFARIFYQFKLLSKHIYNFYGETKGWFRFDSGMGFAVSWIPVWYPSGVPRVSVTGTWIYPYEIDGNVGVFVRNSHCYQLACTTKVASKYNDTIVNVPVSGNFKVNVGYKQTASGAIYKADTGSIRFYDTIPVPVNKLTTSANEIRTPQPIRNGAIIKTFDINGRPVKSMGARGVYFLWDGGRMKRQIKL